MSRSLSLIALLVLVATTLFSGCSEDPTGPTEPVAAGPSHEWVISTEPAPDAEAGKARGRMRYPLQAGNVWKYKAHVQIRTEPDEGEPHDQEVIRITKSEIVGASDFYGRCYITEERTITEDVGDGNAFTQFVHYRQDRSGLYELTTSLDGPDGSPVAREAEHAFARELRRHSNSAAWTRAFAQIQQRMEPLYEMRCHGRRGGALEDELTRLDYPLRRHKSWVVVDDAFRMTAAVECRVVLDLPVGRTPAWKVRLESSLFGPDDLVHTFYGKDGYLGWQVFAITEATDENGFPIGTVTFTDEEYLEDLEIDRRGELPCEREKPRDKPTVELEAR